MARRKAGLFFGLLVGWIGWIFHRSRKQKPVLDLQEELVGLPGSAVSMPSVQVESQPDEQQIGQEAASRQGIISRVCKFLFNR